MPLSILNKTPKLLTKVARWIHKNCLQDFLSYFWVIILSQRAEYCWVTKVKTKDIKLTFWIAHICCLSELSLSSSILQRALKQEEAKESEPIESFPAWSNYHFFNVFTTLVREVVARLDWSGIYFSFMQIIFTDIASLLRYLFQHKILTLYCFRCAHLWLERCNLLADKCCEQTLET